MKLEDIIDHVNIAEELDSDTLWGIGSECKLGYEDDLESRSEWEEKNEEWMKLAGQVVEPKCYPWENASNVKYPLLTTAAIQFHARAYPALVPSGNVVKTTVVGYDPTSEKQDKANRIAKHMTYQVMEQMPEWEEDMDKLCLTLPIVGCAFKKTYYSPLHKRNISELVSAKQLVVNYWAKSIEDAYRKTQIIEMNKNQLLERIRSGIYLEIELGDPRAESLSEIREDADMISGIDAPSNNDDATPYIICEQHTYLDLDEDGYKEPYIVTFEESSGQVLRIVANFEAEDVETNQKGQISRITPFEHFTKFSFIPNPDGGFYDVGFGILLGPINEASNTLINQLIDAGTLSNMQSGFLGRGIKLKGSDQTFTPGEWKTINATGDDLRKNILPLPVREPSGILFQLLAQLLESGQRLASTTDMMVGENPGQNQAATTTLSVVEQGMKVFTAIYKRIHRSLKKEYKKLFKLNSQYLNMQEYFTVVGTGEQLPISGNDYNPEMMDVVPSADPQAVTITQKLAKAQALMELIPLGVNPQIVLKRMLEAQEQENIEELMQPMPPKGPDPETAFKMKELEVNTALKSKELQIKEKEVAIKAQSEGVNAQTKMRDSDIKAYQAVTTAQNKGSFEYNTGANK